MVSRHAFLVDLDLALGGASDDHGLHSDVDSPSEIVTINDDQDPVCCDGARFACLSDLGEHRLTATAAMILERHFFHYTAG